MVPRRWPNPGCWPSVYRAHRGCGCTNRGEVRSQAANAIQKNTRRHDPQRGPPRLERHRERRRRIHSQREHRGPVADSAPPDAGQRHESTAWRAPRSRSSRRVPRPRTGQDATRRGCGRRPASRSRGLPSGSRRPAVHPHSSAAPPVRAPPATGRGPSSGRTRTRQRARRSTPRTESTPRRTRWPARRSRRSPTPTRRAPGRAGRSSQPATCPRTTTGASDTQPCNAIAPSTHTTHPCSPNRATSTTARRHVGEQRDGRVQVAQIPRISPPGTGSRDDEHRQRNGGHDRQRDTDDVDAVIRGGDRHDAGRHHRREGVGPHRSSSTTR